MAIGGKGKVFEQKFLLDWKQSFPNTFILRLHDLTTGYKVTSQNPSDFIAFADKKLFLLELKSHEGNTLPFSAIPQYDRLLAYKNMKDVFPYIIAWFVDKEKIIAIPILEAERMIKDGKKSINIKMLEERQYNIIEIPTVKKRFYLEADYSILIKEI